MGDDALSAGAVARRLGVAVTTLRTWHQRYGLGPSRHVPGQHRRYTGDDLVRLEIMRRLTAEGVPPAEAARWARRAPHVPEPTPASVGPPGASPPQPASRPEPAAPRDGGGFAIPVGRAGPAARGLARAAMRLDSVAMRELIERSVATNGVVHTWDAVLVPVLVGIGERHAATAGLVEVEHLLSRCVSEVLGAVARPHPAAPAPRVLLACADEEQHSLPLEALAAALAEVGVACRLLGARVPPAALAEAVARTGPAVVALWSHAPSTARTDQLGGLLTGAHRPLLVLAAGPGWRRDALPTGVAQPRRLIEAIALIVAAEAS
ncbi:B12 binding domain-containing protein [Micromonospora pattaloongensis]|uniref:B12 binding domain-containing protein n=1 Tax=Micromonospora pattaloongensis TaxID=405436 RepID=A0A1H3ICL4_9ACTN|nr:MerR family transcriptional regulator [Micromonospora pattaloongensis]SDY24838.1 B12 binding domain-containing protein [Micromonospora pattaloongensis]